jgi:hypothetical protein
MPALRQIPLGDDDLPRTIIGIHLVKAVCHAPFSPLPSAERKTWQVVPFRDPCVCKTQGGFDSGLTSNAGNL